MISSVLGLAQSFLGRTAAKFKRALAVWRDEGALGFFQLLAARICFPDDFHTWRRLQLEAPPPPKLPSVFAPYQTTFQLPPVNRPRRDLLTFAHSGNIGDIIFSLPSVRAIMETSDVHQCRFLLKLDTPAPYHATYRHPLGNVLLNRATAEMLLPLLRSQAYIGQATIYEGQPIDLDLDAFRKTGFNYRAGSIARWYTYAFHCCPNVWDPWIEVPPDPRYADYIVINRTFRYGNADISYHFLDSYPKLLFIGHRPEFEAIRKQVPRACFYESADFLELATIIRGCRLFVGNQSFCFALAEAMKVPRVLEASPAAPTNVLCGLDGYDVLSQDMLEKTVVALLNRLGRQAA